MKTNLIKKLIIGAAMLSSFPAWANPYLLGKVSLSEPIVDATVRIYDTGRRLLETLPQTTSENGIIEATLSTDLPDFIVEVTGGTLGGVPFTGILEANVTGHDAEFTAPLLIGNSSPSNLGTAGPAEDIMMSLAKSAASKVGGEAAGWVMNMLLGSSSKDKTAEELAEIKNELTKHTQMLNAISSKIDALSSQLDKAIERVIDEIKQTGYEGRAQQLDAPMSKIKAVFDTLVLYTQADPKVDRTHEIEKLRDYIKIDIVAALFQIHDSLVGTPTVTGLMPTWGAINAKKVQGFPTFLTNDYLRPANLQAEYYRYWEIIAGTLIIEAYHAEHTTPDPTVGKHYYDLLKSKLDDQRKFVPGAELADDNTIVDTRTKLMWMRSMTMEPGTKQPLWYFPYAVKYIRDLRIGGYSDWKIPTLEQWQGLAKGMASPRVSNGMNARGFKGIQDTYAILPGNCVFNMFTEKAGCNLRPETSAAAPFAVRSWTPWP